MFEDNAMRNTPDTQRSPLIAFSTLRLVVAWLVGWAVLGPGCSPSDCVLFDDVEEKWKDRLGSFTDCGASLMLGSSEANDVAACLVENMKKCEPAFGQILTSGAAHPIRLRDFLVFTDCSAVILEVDFEADITQELLCAQFVLSADASQVLDGSDCHDGNAYSAAECG